VLVLKVCLVPSFLMLLSLAGKRWGPDVAGWLAGLPLVTGPILFFLAMAHGTSFASGAAAAALAAVGALLSFSVAYAHASQRSGWPVALLAGLLAWAAAASLLSLMPLSPLVAGLVAAATLSCARHLFPAVRPLPAARNPGAREVVLRMVAGALLTVGVTLVSGTLGFQWSGLLAVFPVMGTILAVFCHRDQGAAFAASLLRAMSAGLYSSSSFCLCLCLTLPRMGVAASFALSTGVAVLVQSLTRKRLVRASGRPASTTVPVEP